MTLPTLDRDALRRGVTVAVAITVPAAVVSWLTDRGTGRGGPAGLLTLVVVLGLLLGGFAAASQQRLNAPLTHSLITVLGVVAMLQIMRVVRLGVLGRPLNLPASLGNLLLGLVTSVAAGLLAGQKTGKRRADN